jgi:asparagine synthase (glutamine-hydrolysing)
MCGIAGYYGKRQLSPAQIDACLALMGRRGPDGQDWIERKVGDAVYGYLLHSRLRIIDLDPRANQPFVRGQGHLCFNGEIYNYLELRQRLARAGERFTTESDTEVLAALLARYGRDKIDDCEGMWALAWLDDSGLVLSRDRFGEKPLYLYEDATGIYFGSEPKFIFALLGQRLPINVDHLYRYLVNGYKSLYKQRQTFFSGLKELKPGTWLKVDPAGCHQSQPYWQPKFDQYQTALSFEEAVSAAQAALINSVRLRLRADVPIAFCLSGGVDSNALIAIASRKLNYQVHGFTIMNTDTRYEERDLVETTVQELGLKHTAIPIDHQSFLA